MERIRFESRSLSTALLSYLQGLGWNLDAVQEAFIVDLPLVVPAVSIHFISSNQLERQMGRDKKTFTRPIQVDAYMESKQRAQAIVDNIMEFMDDTPISVVDQNSNILAAMICFDTESISGDTLSPTTTAPELIRWRGIAKCVYEVDYIV